MRRLPFIFVLAAFLLCCVHDRETHDGIILTLPFGKYYNWTNWEMKQMNFRIRDNELLVDTTYGLRPRDFRAHHTEKAADYPEIDKFLKRPITELRDLQNTKSKVSCDSLHQFWIQYEDGSRLDLVKFWDTDDCDPTHHGALSAVYREMKIIQQKYKP